MCHEHCVIFFTYGMSRSQSLTQYSKAQKSRAEARGRGGAPSPLRPSPLYTIFVRFNVPPLFIVPPPREREHVPRDLYTLLDWQEGAVVTHGSSEALRRRRTLTSAGATSSSSRARSRSTGKSAAAGSPLRAPGGARRKRDFGRARVELRSIVGSTLCNRPRSTEARPSFLGRLPWSGRTPRGTRAQARGTATVPPSWQHADVPPSLKCTPLLRLYPLPWSRSAIGYIKTHKDGTLCGV